MKKIVIYYFLSLLFSLSIFSSGVIDSQDGFQYLAVARNIYYKYEASAPVYEYDVRKNIHMSTTLNRDGKTISPTGLGFSLAMVPAVALTDLVYKIYHVSPPVHFPLENDWLILLLASFTNAFFGALLGVTLFLFLVELGSSKKQALFLSLIGLFTTNLLVYTKHSFAHMMFISLFFVSLFLMKKYFQNRKNAYLLFSGVFFGVATISYNLSFLLTILPLGLYFLLLSKIKMHLSSIISIFYKSIPFLVGFFPFILVFIWFESFRAVPAQNLSNPVDLAARIISPFDNFPITVFFEGLFGQLFSPGRSIFIYSPILLVILIFWFKTKIRFPEFWVFLTLSAIYIIYHATIYKVGIPNLDTMVVSIDGFWHGEASWGPRYLAILIPVGMLVIGDIYKLLSRKEIIFVFTPLIILGIYIQILGILMPYQIKYHNLQEAIYINGVEFTRFVYPNLIPRYSPIINMSKNLVKLVQNFPKTLNHGPYNVKYYDGIDFPFNVGPERWRTIEGRGYISFDNNSKNHITELAFGLINHVVSESSESAKVQFILNDTPLLKTPLGLVVGQREVVKIPIEANILKPQGNILVIDVDYGKSDVLNMHKQILGLQSFDINGQRQNMESIDTPYVSALGPKMGAHYQNWGGENKDPWKTWDIHTQTYERLPDFWWIRNLYYTDIPKSFILGPLFVIIAAFSISAFKLYSLIKQLK